MIRVEARSEHRPAVLLPLLLSVHGGPLLPGICAIQGYVIWVWPEDTTNWPSSRDRHRCIQINTCWSRPESFGSADQFQAAWNSPRSGMFVTPLNLCAHMAHVRSMSLMSCSLKDAWREVIGLLIQIFLGGSFCTCSSEHSVTHHQCLMLMFESTWCGGGWSSTS